MFQSAPMLSRAEEKRVRALARRRRREAEGLFLAEGVRVVEELLAAGMAPRLALVAPSLGETPRGEALAAALAAAAPVRSLSDAELGRLAGTRTPQGVLVVAETPAAGLDEVTPAGDATALVLDGVQDPGNVGTLARSAAAFGCGMVACLPGTVDPWNSKSVRASAGALFHLAVVDTDLARLGEWLGRHDFALLGADAGGEPVAGRPGRVALAVGNEGAGLSDAVRRRCQGLVAVPMEPGSESLNVAVAAGILLYELTRERG